MYIAFQNKKITTLKPVIFSFVGQKQIFNEIDLSRWDN